MFEAYIDEEVDTDPDYSWDEYLTAEEKVPTLVLTLFVLLFSSLIKKVECKYLFNVYTYSKRMSCQCLYCATSSENAF